MTTERLSIAAFLILIAVISILLIRTARLVAKSGDSGAVLLLFALLVNDLYWIAYEALRPDVRMPFAANEFGEAAFYLLFCSAVSAVFRDRGEGRTEGIWAAVFALASVGLWIAWSGEWVQDLMAAPVHVYYLYVTAVSLRQGDALAPREWRLWGGAAAALIAMQTAIFFVPGGLKSSLDLACYLLMFSVQAVLIFKAVRAIGSGMPAKTQLALSFGAMAWSVSVVYMSAGYWYVAGLLYEAVSMSAVQISYEREILR